MSTFETGLSVRDQSNRQKNCLFFKEARLGGGPINLRKEGGEGRRQKRSAQRKSGIRNHSKRLRGDIYKELTFEKGRPEHIHERNVRKRKGGNHIELVVPTPIPCLYNNDCRKKRKNKKKTHRKKVVPKPSILED